MKYGKGKDEVFFLFLFFLQGMIKILSQIGQDRVIVEQQMKIVNAQAEKTGRLKKVSDVCKIYS